MSDHASRLAETIADVTSRRGFLKRLSRAAGTAAAVLGGTLAASTARAGKPERTLLCCSYIRGNFSTFTKCVRPSKGCPDWFKGAPLFSVGQVSHCRECESIPG